MKCVRCGRDFPTDIPKRNVLKYPGTITYSCPYCNKAYRFSSRVEVYVNPIEDRWIVNKCKDDYGREIIKDMEYEGR